MGFNQAAVTRGQSSRRAPSLPPELRSFCRLVVLLTGLSAVYCFAAFLLHKPNPFDWPFPPPKYRFEDFTIYQQKFLLFHQASFFQTWFPFTYPAPMALLFETFFRFGGRYALRAFVLFSALAFVVPAALFGVALERKGLRRGEAALVAGTALLLSWPAWLILDRGNVEIFVWVALVLATWAYATGKEWTAAVCFGVAASLKLFPFVFLVLFLTRRKYPKLVVGVATFLAVTVISLAVLGPTIGTANRGIAMGLQYFNDHYVVTFRSESGFDHSMLGLIKVGVSKALHVESGGVLSRIAKVYLWVTAVGGILLYFLRIRRLPWLNQLLALSIISIYFTPFSGDGTLIHLYYAFALCSFLAIAAWRKGVEIDGLRMIFLCFAYLLSTQSFLVLRVMRVEGQAKCVVLGYLLYLALRFRLGPAVEGDQGRLVAEPGRLGWTAG